MSRFWTLLSNLHSLAGPVVMLLYPLYASVMAIKSPAKDDDEQWLAYWILYSLLTLTEMVLQSVLEWIPIWFSVKLVFMAWLVLPQFRGAAFIYERGSKRLYEENGRALVGGSSVSSFPTSALIGGFLGGCKCFYPLYKFLALIFEGFFRPLTCND